MQTRCALACAVVASRAHFKDFFGPRPVFRSCNLFYFHIAREAPGASVSSDLFVTVEMEFTNQLARLLRRHERIQRCVTVPPDLKGGPVRRRDFLAAVGNALIAWPRAAGAQQPGERMRGVGVLEETAEDDKERNSQFAKFREGLASFGWVEGRTVHIEHRFAAAHPGQYQPLARE